VSEGGPTTVRGRLAVGLLFWGVGFLVMYMSVSHPEQVNGPWWLGFAAGWVFAAAGLAVAVQGTELQTWVGGLAVATLLLGFAAIGNWIAFGPGPRGCSGGISLLFFSGSRSAGEMECRVAFGLGAVILDAILFMGAMSGLARLVGSPRWAARLEKAGKGVFFFALLPLLLLAGALLLVQQGAGWLRSRLAPPRRGR